MKFAAALFILIFFSLPVFVKAEIIDVLVGASADDAGTDEGVWSLTRNFLDAGNAYKDKTGMIFRGITIPQGSVITNAYISVVGNGYINGDPRVRLYGELSANPNTYSTLADYDARTLTTAYVDWDINLAAGVTTQSPNISSIIQELVNAYGYTNGVIAIMSVTTGSPTNSIYTTWDSYNYGPASAAKLHIEYAMGGPDTFAPTRSNGQPTGALAAGTSQTNISLATNESATCKYSTTAGTSYDSMSNTFSTTGGISHSTSITGLANGSSYAYYVRCSDTANNKNTDDFAVSFSVALPAPPDTTPPIISGVQVSNVTLNSAIIGWTTDDLSNSIVNYGRIASLGSTQSDANLINNHSITLTGLSSNTTYYYQVRSCNSGNYCSNSSTATFSTLAPATVSPTTVGQLSLSPAFENMGVISSFSGDSNGNNNAILEYREAGGTWKQGMDMTVDRRDYLYEFTLTGEVDNNPIPNSWKNQWRAIIFGLKPNTDYEVRVTYSDPDGVSGFAVATTKTRNDNPPSNGRSLYVSPSGSDSNNGLTVATAFRTIQQAINIVNPGDTVFVMPGTYTEDGTGARPGLTITRSGTESNYITFRSYDMNNKAVIHGQSRLWYGFLLSGSYIRIKGFKLQDFNGDHGGIVGIDTNAVGNIVEDNIMINPGGHWADSGVLVSGMNSLVQRNHISTTEAGTGAPSFGIFFENTSGGNVIRENTIITPGFLKDGISGLGNMRIWGGPGPASFIHDNYIEGPWDDGIEVEGGNVNVAVYDNTIKNNKLTCGGCSMNMGIGHASTIVGPVFSIGNVIINHGDAAFKLGSNSYGNIYIYHNTIYTPDNAGTGYSHFGNNAVADNVKTRNNLYITSTGRGIEVWGETSMNHNLNDLDYDAFCSTRGGSPCGLAGIWYRDSVDLATFRSRYGQEMHGMAVSDPKFVDAANDNLRLKSDSPIIDKGEVIVGINDANSPWAYKGTAPDIGAYEYNSGPIVLPSTIRVNLDLEAKPAKGNRSLTLYIYQQGTVNLIFQKALVTNSQDDLDLNLSDFTNDRYLTYDIKIVMPGYLAKKSSYSLTGPITFPKMETGDLNNDNIINSLDWAQMQSVWHASSQQADPNEDGIVNTIDFSFLNRNWLKRGD